jgi:molybdopterin-guanine dinucleotide biosynthesis protein A
LRKRLSFSTVAAANHDADGKVWMRVPMHESTIGILLAGGRARRMGGGDKAFKTLAGVSILTRLIALLQPQCDRLLINAGGDVARFACFGLPVAADDVNDFAGPLAGVLAGLDYVARGQPDVPFALSVPTDTPFLPADLVARLHAARRAARAELACARSGGVTHPVIALWPVGIRTELRQALVGEGLHKVDRFTSRYRLAYADWPTVPFDPFFNVNTPDDLTEAERILKAQGEPPSP